MTDPQWVFGPIKLPTSKAHLIVFDRLRELSGDQLGELLALFELPRNRDVPITEEEFVLASCLLHKWQQDTTGSVTERVQACRDTYTGRYKDLILRIEKGEDVVAKKNRKAKTPREKKDPGVRGKLYEASDREPKELGKQAQLVYDALKKVGPAQPQTITDAVKDKLETRQPPERVVAFYLAQFKKSGYVRTTDPTKAA